MKYKRYKPVLTVYKPNAQKDNYHALKSKQKAHPLVANLETILNSSYGDTRAKEELAFKGFVHDSTLSTSNVHISYNPKNESMLVTVRGTDVKQNGIHDLITDLHTPFIALGLENAFNQPRYREAMALAASGKHRYNPKETIVAGHSLGGAIAQEVGATVGANRIITYNAAPHRRLAQKDNRNEDHYRSLFDPVSLFNPRTKSLPLTITKTSIHSTSGAREINLQL